MKKIILLALPLALFSLNSASGQKFNWNIEASMRLGVSELNIQDEINASGIKINKVGTFGALLNLEYFLHEQHSVELGSGLVFNRGEGYRYSGLPVHLSYQYHLPSSGASVGLRLGYEVAGLSLFQDDGAPVDMSSGIQSSFVELSNGFWNTGILASYPLTERIRFQAGYVLGLGGNEWKSDYTTLSRPIGEKSPSYAYLSFKFSW